MDHFDEGYFSHPNHPPSSGEGNNQVRRPSPDGLDHFDFESLLSTAVDETSSAHDPHLEASMPIYDDDIMDLDFTPKIEYHQDYSEPNKPNKPNPPVLENGALALPRPVISMPTGISVHRDLYINSILNRFDNPATPLHIIDVQQFPFEEELQSQLERELARQQKLARDRETFTARGFSNDAQESNHSNQRCCAPTRPNPAGSPTRAPVPTSEAGMKIGKNKRPENIRNFNPAKFYKPLGTPPAAWGSINPATNEKLFQYTEYGELNPLSTFTAEQIAEYIGNHPLHYANGDYDGKNSSLILRIQTVPADSASRYPNKASDKCRFSCCPDPRRTIRKGEFRICLDEQGFRHAKTDPFHNAGYVHLFCLEKCLDFPQICKTFNVQPDVRVLREGKNKMAITRDHESMEEICEDFIRTSLPWAEFGHRPQKYYQYTLSYALTMEHLDKQPKHIQAVRQGRGGNHIDLHQNNLDLYMAIGRGIREDKSGRPKISRQPRQNRKRKERDEDTESVDPENVLNPNILDEDRDYTEPRLSKRPRRSLRHSRSP
jgi:hypothetical protein